MLISVIDWHLRLWRRGRPAWNSGVQLPLKLAWAVTIHKSQGLTLDKVVIDVGEKELSTGLTFVACSRVRHLEDLLFDPPFTFQRVANLSKSQRLQERLLEDTKLLLLEEAHYRILLPLPTPLLPPALQLCIQLPSAIKSWILSLLALPL